MSVPRATASARGAPERRFDNPFEDTNVCLFYVALDTLVCPPPPRPA